MLALKKKSVKWPVCYSSQLCTIGYRFHLKFLGKLLVIKFGTPTLADFRLLFWGIRRDGMELRWCNESGFRYSLKYSGSSIRAHHLELRRKLGSCFIEKAECNKGHVVYFLIL